MEADGKQSDIVGGFCPVSSGATRLMRFIVRLGLWLHKEIVEPSRLPWC